MHYSKLTAAVAKSQSEQTRARKGTISALVAAVMVLGTVWADFTFAPLPVKADSEASSESGAYLRQRRGRRRNYQNQGQNQQSMAARQEIKREAKERNQFQQRQQRNLARGPQIKEYHPRPSQSNQGQSNQGQSNQGQNNPTP